MPNTSVEQPGPPAARRTRPGRAEDRAAYARRLADRAAGLRALDALADLAGRLLGTGAAQISLISDVQTVAGAAGTAAPTSGQESPAEDSLCTVTVRAAVPLVVVDAAADGRVAQLPPVAAGAVGAYLGVPLVAGDGHVIGALCVYEPGPRSWTAEETQLLEELAGPVVAELELAALSAEYENDQLVWQLAVDAAGIGAFDLDLTSGTLRWDDRLTSLFGFGGGFGGTVQEFLDRVHPDDVARVRSELGAAVRRCGSYAVEHRLLLDGRVRWIASRGQALPGPDGRAVRVVGAAYDVTATHEGEARVTRVLDEMPSAVLHLDADWRVGYANPEAERVTGLSREQLIGSVLWELFPGAVGSEFERQYRRAVASGEAVSFEAYYPPPLDAWFEVRAWPTDGGLSLYFIDVTARHHSQQQVAATARRHELLARVTDALTGTLDGDEAAARLAPLLTDNGLADWCLITLVDQRSPLHWRLGLRDAGYAHVDPDQRHLVQRYAGLRLAALDDVSFLARVLRSGEPITIPADATARVAAVLVPGEARDLLERLAPESAFVTPLGGRGRTVGLLSAFRGQGRSAFSREARATLVDVADRAGLALDNARLYAEQRALAEGLQRSLMTAPPEPDHFEVVVRYEPAAETAQVGGDWYDAFLQQDGATVMVIGDVVGHDTVAAAAMGQVRGLLRGIAVHSGGGPAAVLQGVDRVMETLRLDTTATGIVARLEHEPPGTAPGTTRLLWSNAGHPPPMAIDERGQVSTLAPGEPDLLLGLDPDTRRAEPEVLLQRGTTLLLYTDGLVERRGQPLDEGLDRLHDLLGELAARDLGLDELCDAVLDAMLTDRPEDDVALVAVRLQG